MVKLLKNVPLNAIRAFEATARTGSFAAAARELAVTPAAISQQVKGLEMYWGRTLFMRQGNSIVLTDAGTTAYPAIAESLKSLGEISATMRGASRRARLVLSVPHSIAETWLSLRLKDWLGRRSGLNIDIRAEDDPVDFTRNRVHVRIFYGHSLYADFKNEVLFTDEIIAVASPDFIKAHGAEIEDIPNRLLIRADWGQGFASVPGWLGILSKDYRFDANEGLQVATSSIAIAFALQHAGAILVPGMMVEHLLNSGQLVKFDTPPLTMPRPYSVAYPHAISRWPEVIDVIAALHNCRPATIGAHPPKNA